MDQMSNILRPVLTKDDAINRRQRILSNIQWGLLLAVIFFLMIAVVTGMPVTALVMGMGLVVLMATVWLARRGYLQPASLILLLMFLFVINCLLWVGHGIHDIAVIAYPVVLIIASLILDRRCYLLVAGLTVVSSMFIILVELTGFHFTKASNLTEISDLIIVPVILALVAWPMRLIADHLMQSLERSGQLAKQQAALLEQTQRRAELLSTLNRVSWTLTTDMTLDEVLKALYRTICEVVPTDSFYVALYDEASGVISFPVFYTPRGLIQAGTSHIDESPGLSGEVIQRRRTLYLPDIDEPQVTQGHMIIHTDPSPTRTYVGIPLIVKEQVIGLMSVQSEQPNAYNADQISLLETIASQAAIAVEKARLYTELHEELVERARAENALRQR